MSEHRPVLDPSILGRLATSMVQFEQAWLSDVEQLRAFEQKLLDTERLLNAATDRSSDLQADLRAARQENSELIRRNAHLEAQLQKLYENSLDAKDALINLAGRAVEVARTAPTVQSRNETPAHVEQPAPRRTSGAWKDPEKNPPGDEDGTKLPAGMPSFISVTRPPINQFQSQHAVAAE